MACRPRDHFQCGGSSGQCIPWAGVCDGTVHCDNKADEECGKQSFKLFMLLSIQLLYSRKKRICMFSYK